MKSVKTRTHFCDRHRDYSNEFKAAASLHCHTYHSREFLSFIPHYTSKIPIVSKFYKAEMERYEKNNGKSVNFNQAYWTPPVSPMQVLDAETTQINQYLSLSALVSITDHDEIEACMRLQVLNESDQIPVSLEWTVPYERTCFHIGVHNLPQHKAADIASELKKYAYKANDAMELRDLFAMLNECKDTLVVLNHPLWDLENIGKEVHEEMLGTFLARYGSDDNGDGNWIHAFEINGFRSWRENKVVMNLAEDMGFPTVTGGDRHGNRANTLLNLTTASSFTEYVSQIRNDRQSNVIIMPDYGHSKFPGLALTARTFESIADVIRYNPNHPLGQYRWTDRIFIDVGNELGLTPLSHYWKNGGPAWIRAVLWCISKIGSREVLALTNKLTNDISLNRGSNGPNSKATKTQRISYSK